MIPVLGIALSVLLMFLGDGTTASQQDWDKLDVVDGPNPTLRYGFYTEPSGQLRMGRYYFFEQDAQLRVRLAPYGRTAVELPVRRYDRNGGVLELGWEGKPGRTCRLKRQNERLFLGNCMEDLVVMPMAIRVADESDSEWMGVHLPVSETDTAILKRARRILAEQETRNLNGDRACEDDLSTGRFSVFCALFHASVEVAGEYRHRRPAMRAIRQELARRYPGKYAHRLRDINNSPDIPDEAFLDAIDAALARLASELNDGEGSR